MSTKLKSVMQSVGLLLFVSLSSLASAHSGHGASGMLQHEMEHNVWLLSGVLCVAVVVFRVVARNRQDN